MTFVAILVKVTLVLGIAATVQSVLARRASAAARHLVWTLAITGVLLVPILAISLPDWTPFEYTQPAGFVPVIGAGTPEPPPLNVPAPIPAGDNAINWSTVFTAVYLAGVALLLVRLFLQHLWAHRIIRTATPIADAHWLQLLGECAAAVGVRRPVRLLRTTAETMPAATGIWQSAIVLPAIADTWPDDRRQAVLLHELAHVERHDCLTQTLAAVACAVYWAHPIVWWTAMRLHAERERACDDRVLSTGANAPEYAGHLLELAYALGQHAAPAAAVTMTRPRELEGRMLAMLDAARNRAVPTRRNRLAAAAILVALTVPVAGATVTPRFYVLGASELRTATRAGSQQSAAAATPRLAFDVASIKPTPEITGPGADFAILAGGTLHARNNPVLNFIVNSYGVPYYTVIGGPDWIRSDKYDLEAKADRERPRAEIMQMLRTLLAERFQMRVHRETRELPAYVVTVARGGAKLRPSKEGDCVLVDRTRPVPPPVPLAPGDTRRPECGNNLMTSRGATPPNLRWSAVHIDAAAVSASLANYFRRPVVDRTGLTGFFDVELELPPLQPIVSDAGGDQGISVFTVLQEQLGLRVEEGKGPVDVLVVDRLERPTEN